MGRSEFNLSDYTIRRDIRGVPRGTFPVITTHKIALFVHNQDCVDSSTSSTNVSVTIEPILNL